MRHTLSWLRLKGLFGLFIIGTIINFFETPLLSLQPIFISEFHEGIAIDLAIVVGLSQAGMLLSGIFLMFNNRYWKRKSVVRMTALYVQIAGYLIQSLTIKGQFWMMGIGAFIMGSTFPFTSTMNSTIMHIVVPAEKQARVITVLDSIGIALTPIGTLMAGYLVSKIGYVFLFTAGILIGAILITIIWFSSKVSEIDFLVQKLEAQTKT